MNNKGKLNGQGYSALRSGRSDIFILIKFRTLSCVMLHMWGCQNVEILVDIGRGRVTCGNGVQMYSACKFKEELYMFIL